MPCKVRVLSNGEIFHKERMLKAGEIVEMDHDAAARHVERGEASFTIRVRALKTCGPFGNRYLNEGEEIETSEDHAVQLYRAGRVDVLNRSEMDLPGKLVRDAHRASAPAEYPSDEEKVSVVILKDFLDDTRIHPPGVTLTIGMERAKRAAAAGWVRFVNPPDAAPKGGVIARFGASANPGDSPAAVAGFSPPDADQAGDRNEAPKRGRTRPVASGG
jgi:hypothetical protein